MAFLKESQGHLGDLSEKSHSELIDLLGRQEKILQNKKFINSLKDKGQKIEHFVEELKRIIAENDEIDNTAGLFEGMSLKQDVMDIDVGDAVDEVSEKKEVRLIEKIQESKTKKDPLASQQKKGTFKPFSTLRSDVIKLKESPVNEQGGAMGQSDQMVTGDSDLISDALGRVSDEMFKEYQSKVAPFVSPPEQEFMKFSSEKQFKLLTFDIKTNSNGSDAEVCQISVVSSEGDSFSEYCLPAYISKAAAKSTGLSVEYQDGKRIMNKNGKNVDAHSRQVVLKRFAEYISKQKCGSPDAVIVLVGTTNVAQRRTLLYNLRTFSIPAPKMYFANCIPLLRSTLIDGKINVDTCDLESVFYSLFNYKLDISDSLLVSQAIYKVLNDPNLKLTAESIINGIQCVQPDIALADLDYVIDKRRRLSSLRGKLFDSSVASHDVISAAIAERIAAAGLGYNDLDCLFSFGRDAFVSVLARPPSSCAGWGARVTDNAEVLLKLYSHFTMKNKLKLKYEGVLFEPSTGKSHTAKLVTLEESMTLQKVQKSNLEELQAKQASARLAGNVHIKMQPFDPEATKSSKRYREPAPEADIDKDSSDEEELDYPD